MGPGRPNRRPRDYFYGEVLRLPPGTRDPDHYTLLGLAFFEEDHDAILRAALERTRVLEACQADPRPAYRQAASRLIADVREARMTLLDPQRRREYDAALIGTGSREPEERKPITPLELAVGAMFAGRYRVLGEARRGGLGVVYEALDSNLRTRVHLSVLGSELSSDRQARRAIEQAARSAAQLDHPCIVRVDEVGEAGGLLYLRSRSPEGVSLPAALDATPHRRFEARRAREVLRRIASALAVAHERGVVHGDLQPGNVFLDEEGRVQVADFAVARAVAAAAGTPASRYREPEDEPSCAGDLFALGCIGHELLLGEFPFPTGAHTPRPLPASTPGDLELVVLRMLAREPEQRPASAAEVLDRLAPRRRPRRWPLLAGAAVLLLGVLVAALLGSRSAAPTLQERAWRWIADGEFRTAIERLERARKESPDAAGLAAPLARAYGGEAAGRERAGDIWSAQLLFEKARALAPGKERDRICKRIGTLTRAALDRVEVTLPEVAEHPVLRIRRGAVPLARVFVGRPIEDLSAAVISVPLDLDEGPHEVRWKLEDAAGNRREGLLRCIVDRTPPVLEILAPADGALQREGAVKVKTRVEDANPESSVTIRGRQVSLVKGTAETTLRLADGEHAIEVSARDRAGHAVRRTVKVIIDSRAPEIRLGASRIVTGTGAVAVKGRVIGRVKSVAVDGKEVELARDGSFAQTVTVAGDRLVPVEALGATGLRARQSVRVVLDRDPPEVAAEFDRRGPGGELLYGAREMEAGRVKVTLRCRDETALAFEPAEGRVAGGVWTLRATEGRRTARLVVRDEAGNRTVLDLALDGHRSRPRLEVECSLDPITSAEQAQLLIRADGPVFLQGQEREPGRVALPLPEGRVEIEVFAEDRYGNRSLWTRSVLVDRTPPRLELSGGTERGIGRQEVVLRADEALATLRCAGKSYRVNGKTARVWIDLLPGRRRLFAVATDLAGNVARFQVTLRAVNRVLVLDGHSAVRVDLPAALRLETFTIECWVRGTAAERPTAVLGTYDGAGSGFALMWRSRGSERPYALWSQERSGRMEIPARKAWRWSDWVHLALSAGRKKVRFFVNGSLQGSREASEKLHRGKAPLYIGAAPAGRARMPVPGFYFTGALDEVRLSDIGRYPRAFTPPRYLRADDHTRLLLGFDTAKDGLFPDRSGHHLPGRSVGAPELKQEAR